ncbi:MAG: carboxylating nicotinate-nucleotide diphosphorylase [Verrucomicrobiales bacterium]|jgi:nicotinate-nucleotide pyrophosphorylase (carboxylating)|nr:carboxylating nicotinate-nucleotide diphosphorylase [Verrucomicrobiales bacterium]
MQIQPPDPAIIHEAVVRALGEDLGPLDLTTAALVPAGVTVSTRIFVKEPGVLAGIPVAVETFSQLDPSLTVTPAAADGGTLAAGQTVLTASGNAAAILGGERVTLNFLQHLSGIATRARQFVDAVAGTKCQILDTRKTVPGLRHLAKYAVRCGGGVNHRFGLYDAFMPKDNHTALLPTPNDLAAAVNQMRAFNPDAKIIFEADTLEQVNILAPLGVDQILLDNMTDAQLAEAVRIVSGRAKLEASGNMTLERVRAVADTGVDYISIGALTHSVRALDFSLEILPK